MSATAYSPNAAWVCYKCFVPPSIWKLSIRPSDASAQREIMVEADTWQAALAAGRAQLGESVPLPTGATVVSASGEVSLIDPATGYRYVLVPSPPDNADNAQPMPAGPPKFI